jgi:uncharacterized membrane protein YfcA
MAWPLTLVIIIGTIPGIFIGYYLRVLYMPDPRAFKLFAGCVLLYIGLRLLYEMTPRSLRGRREMKALEDKFDQQMKKHKELRSSKIAAGIPAEAVVKTISVSLRKVEYEFWGQRFSFNTIGMLLMAFIVGIIGGTYGIGGGAIIAPFCVAVFQLPVYTVAGAALMGTFITSIAGVFFYSMTPTIAGPPTTPDWLLGSLLGFGGFFGMYTGARLQKYVPQKCMELVLGIFITCVAVSYIWQYLR